LVTDLREGGRQLVDALLEHEALADGQVLDVLRLAIEICGAAHEQGLRLLSLSPRCFVLDADGTPHVTSLETLCRAAEPAGTEAPTASEIVRLFAEQRSDIAPEVQPAAAHSVALPRRPRGKRARPCLPASVDTFALGALLSRLGNREPRPLQHADLAAESGRRLAEIGFHCLAEDPHLRFRSPEHLRLALDDWLGLGEDAPPLTVPLAGGLRIGKYPVVSAQYARVCAETHPRRPCPDFGAGPPYRERQEARAPNPRLAAPLCPIVGVSLEDADAYCLWLTRKTSRVWRLPREAEWLRAAGPSAYPWGEAPPAPTLANYDRHWGGPTAVGAFGGGASACGCLDMAGNVWEWCSDFMARGDPQRVLKGGAYDFAAEDLRLSTRRGALVTFRSPHVGFRVICEEQPT
jgi:hypothetical protein